MAQEEFREGDKVEWNTPSREDPRHREEQAHLRYPGQADRRSPPQRTTRATLSRAREEWQAGRLQTRCTKQGLGGKKWRTTGSRSSSEFDRAVNMTPEELEEWLQTEESRSVGQSDGGGESKGHESGRRIVEIKHKKEPDYTEDDIEHMKRVNSYVKRHLGQGLKKKTPRTLSGATH